MSRLDSAAKPGMAAGFNLARLLRDPTFRARLLASGWTSGQHIVMAVDDEPFIEIIAKMLLHQTGGLALVAIQDEDSPHGLGLFTVTASEAPTDDDVLHVDAATSVGMIYSYLHPRKWYVPHEWSRTLLLERAVAG